MKERWRRVPKTSHFGFSPLTCAQTPELLLCENPNLGRIGFDAKIGPFLTPLQLSLDTYDYCIKMEDFHFDMYRCILRLSVKRRKMLSFVFYFFHNLVKMAPMS